MPELGLSKNALRVLEARYLQRDVQGKIIETPEQLFESVAHGVACAELLLGSARQASLWENKYFDLLTSQDFLPNSPTLMNGGKPLGQLSACFVLPIEDCMESIFEAVKQMALVQRTGGGTGFSFSRLRPRGEIVASTSGEASGPVAFMRIFDCATENIKQGGKRRGANMGVLRVDHPDILEFVTAKLGENSLKNFNISVGVGDRFMDAVRQDLNYELIHPHTGRSVGTLGAKKVYNTLVEAAWRTGDPGLLFLDTINRANPTRHLGSIEATNPCGEIPLLPYESCNLGSINLAHMMGTKNGHRFVDWEKLRETTRYAVRFLDDVIEVNKYPLPEIEQMTLGNRKIGLGVMGFAEMLIRLGISYDSDQAVEMAGQTMRAIADEAFKASQELAKERGVFPNWKGSIYETRGVRIRNATCTAIAPTGTISIIAGTSASIEPWFALAYKRTHVLNDQNLYETNPLFLEYLERYELNPEEIVHEVLEKGKLSEVRAAPNELKQLFVTALELPSERHLQIQAAFQRYVDNSVSKTINMPHDAKPEDVAKVYWKAWKLGLKGITVYRYASKSAQVLELGVEEEPHHYDHGSRCDPEECKV